MNAKQIEKKNNNNIKSTEKKNPTARKNKNMKILESCDQYHKQGHRRSGYYLIKPGPSPPFKVRISISVQFQLFSGNINQEYIGYQKHFWTRYSVKNIFQISNRFKKREIKGLVLFVRS